MRVSPGAKISEAAQAWRLLGAEQRVAAVGAILLVVSTFGSFTFVEAAQVLTALAVLLLLKRRADGYQFHLPFGDGTAVAGAGLWAALLILVRMFDRPLGQNLLALGCAAIVFAAGMRERAKRPMDDVPPETALVPRWPERKRLPGDPERTQRIPGDAERTQRIPGDPERTQRIPGDAERTQRIAGDAERTQRLRRRAD